MIDKSLGIFLMVLFGVSGAAILVLTWLWPMPVADRIFATFIGSSGLVMALVRALMLKPLPVRADTEQSAVKVESKN